MPGIVDMHCHVLPGLDDGPPTMEDSLAILREADRQGIRTMIATPHFHPGRYMVSSQQVLNTLEAVKACAAEEKLQVELLPGQECYYYSDLVRELNAGRALTMAGTRFVLVEFDPEVLYSVIKYAVRELSSNGYWPIIAHYERYRCLFAREDRLEELRSQNARLQLNFDRLLDRDIFLRRNRWRLHVRDGFVDFLGSDTHGMHFRPLHVAEAAKWLYEKAGDGVAAQIMERNVQPLLAAYR